MDKKKIICPKCGQENASISIDCLKCGIVFSKYYGVLARDETDEEKRAELLKRKEEEEAKAEALRRKKEEEEAKAEALRRKKEEEEAKAEALRKQEEEEKAKAEALRRKKEEEEAEAEALRKQNEEEELLKRKEEIIHILKPKTKMKDLLKKYEGQTIGINYDNSSKINDANLVKVGDDIFSILIMDNGLMKSYPLRNIMSVTEGVDGVRVDNVEGKPPFSIIIHIYHQLLI